MSGRRLILSAGLAAAFSSARAVKADRMPVRLRLRRLHRPVRRQTQVTADSQSAGHESGPGAGPRQFRRSQLFGFHPSRLP